MNLVPEHYTARWERLGLTFNVVGEDEKGYWFNFNKKGNLSPKRAHYFENPVTILNTCFVCGKTSTPKKVQYRSKVHGWIDDKTYNRKYWDHAMLCMGCWNKVRPIEDRLWEAREIRRLTNKLNGEIKKWQKSQHLAN